MDLLLTGNDLVFSNGFCPVTRDLAEATTQRLIIKLNTFLNEWFLNTEYGIPYYESIFGKQRLKSTIDNIFQNKILEETNVIRIAEFSSSISSDRVYSMTFKVLVQDGTSTNPITINTGA